MSEIETHHADLLHAFAAVLLAENRIAEAKTTADSAAQAYRVESASAEAALAAAWQKLQGLLEETGEVEVTLPGSGGGDYRIGWSTPRETVKADADAVPDEFVKVERKPKLKEIGDHLKELRTQNLPFPNWARFETGERKLQWRLVKKAARKETNQEG